MSSRVLVVEDNRALAEDVAELLREEGIDVSVCHDADSAEAEARRGGFSVALVDISLAGVADGLELVPKLHRVDTNGEVLLVTGNATLDTAMGAIRRGVYAYLTKPFEPEHLITLVKRAQAQSALKRDKQALTRRLSESEALYRGVVESIESCIVGIDAAGTIRFCNRFASERLVGRSDALIGTSFVAIWLPEERVGAQEQLRRAFSGTPVRDYECSVQVEGKRRRIRWTLTPLSGRTGSLPERDGSALVAQPVLLGAGIDISDRLELERKTAENEAMAAMGTLTTALAHEIRNPLNAAKLQLELLERRARKLNDAEASALLSGPAHLVRTEINRLASLLDEFLDLARPRQIERHALSVAALFDQVLQLQRPVLDSRKIVVKVSCTPAGLQVRGDANKLMQVLINLLTNAVDALQEIEEPRIELGAERSATGVRLSVTDNGPGIPAELVGSAFTPFVTSKPSGTGLGLAVVQKIATQHGGFAELVPLPRGTTATIHIPA